jgi:menaquinone-dependent protoporphyrinogen IX oxidase
MNIMYLGDGSISDGAITISTNAFTTKNISMTLISRLNEIGIDCNISKRNEIKIGKTGSIKFIEYIGRCPVKCYEYKWDI